jgi:hypothetical protein
MFPWLSTTSNILIILEPSIVLVSNLTGDPKLNVTVLIVADIAFLSFLNKKNVGLPPDTE